ncbi:acetolactate synthase [Cereibacter changlensis]|uniref:Acetolactate synthase n=1 Tax=Cereibacter changlensis TaxID=402884 RepID=A0A4U0Z7H1_9RHOB|nr:DUF6497 family protein [Cereibacter changlensis]MBZ4690369.1 hypothetical protein [Cereibacter sp.]TKA97523.1 acetolactate synthase [Cereibacter changlensis]
MTQPDPDPSAAADESVAAPSGQPLTLQEVIWNEPGPAGLTVRFRFVAPEIGAGGSIGFETASADIQALCESYALPRIAEQGPMPAQVVISMADVPLPFGEPAPEATQYFEAFTIRDGICIWEPF